MKHYQNSYCKGAWLHDFRAMREYSQGVLERCTRCGVKMFFKHQGNNAYYLSYHLRSALQVDDPLFAHEYPNFNG